MGLATTERHIGSTRIILKLGDIVTEHADAIVNAANSALRGGAGVNKAIRDAGGPEIAEACDAIRRQRAPAEPCPPGQAMATTAGRLPARFVIHAVGPQWQDGAHGQ